MFNRFPQLLRPLAAAALLTAPALAVSDPDHGWQHLSPWTAETPSAADFFGWVVELEGDWAFVLNRGDDAIHVYHRDGGAWTPTQLLTSPEQYPGQFGSDIELDGDSLYVGAPLSDIAGDAAGAVFRFDLADGSWQLEQTIVSPWPDPADRFGSSLDVDDGWLAVGVPANGTQGYVDVLREIGGTWTAHTRMQHPDPVKLGNAVELRATDDGHFANVFASDTNAYGWTGAVFHFYVHPFGYTLGPAVQAPVPSPNDGYGFDIDFDGEHLVVGASWEDQQGVSTGAAHVYDVDGEVFPPEIDLGVTLLPEPGQEDSGFGKRVAIDGGRIAVGAPQHFPNEVARTGAVYVYRPAVFGPGWQLEARMLREGGQNGDGLGGALAISGAQVLAGASNAGGNLVGEAVFFSLTPKDMLGGQAPADVLATVESYGEGKPGSMGVPQLAMPQPPVPGEMSMVVLSNVPEGTTPVLAWSAQSAAMPFDEGTVLVGQPMFTVLMPTVTQFEQVGLVWHVPADALLAGVELYGQALLVDPGGYGPRRTAQSRGLKVTVGY